MVRGRGKLRNRKPITFPEKLKMGRGDRKTRKGKISIRSYGNARPHKAVAKAGAVKKAAAPKAAAAKKAAPVVKKVAPKKAG
jgi:ribosomal small subunit protein bTHX